MNKDSKVGVTASATGVHDHDWCGEADDPIHVDCEECNFGHPVRQGGQAPEVSTAGGRILDEEPRRDPGRLVGRYGGSQ